MDAMKKLEDAGKEKDDQKPEILFQAKPETAQA